MAEHDVAIVIPTVGRPSLRSLLDSIDASATACRVRVPAVVIVDDRATGAPLEDYLPAGMAAKVLHSGGRGPAAARNLGWRSTNVRWIAFLDDDVLVGPGWLSALLADLDAVDRPGAGPVGGSQGRITVPAPSGRRPTDWERGTAGLQTASWITADMAYRRAALVDAGGFDERFPRAYREDSDLALRVLDAGYRLVRGSRSTTHPVRPSTWWASVHQQRGNADDVLMRRIHGPSWRQRTGAPLGRLPGHLATTTVGVAAVAAAAGGRRRTAVGTGIAWAAMTAEFAWRRIAPGPRNPREIATMVTTSVAIPPAAVWFRLGALLRPSSSAADHPEPATLDPAPAAAAPVGDAPAALSAGAEPARSARPDAVLVDRDGTLVHDVPYNGNPDLVRPMPGAREALDRLRAAGIPIAVISNQSGVGRGLLTADSVAAVNARVEELLGPFQGWFCCPHTADDGCDCRKPAPGLVHRAAKRLGVRAERCVVIGDIGSDMSCAAAAGAAGILVPTPHTLPEEVEAAHLPVENLGAAVDLVLAGRC